MDNENIISSVKRINLSSGSNGWDIHVIFEDGREYKRSGAIAQDLLSTIYSRYFDKKIDLSYAEEKNKTLPYYISEMIDLYKSQYSQPLPLAALEERLGISKYRLCREFTEYLGVSPLQYLNQIRIDAACTLLKNTNMKIYEIGINVGFENTNHFINLFKSKTGYTPGKYRELYPNSDL